MRDFATRKSHISANLHNYTMPTDEWLAECFDKLSPHCLDCPSMQPPMGHTVFEVNEVSCAALIAEISMVCCVLVGIAVFIRVFTRARLIKIYAIEDLMMMLSAIGFAIFVGLTLHMIGFGLGRHQWNVTVRDIHRTRRVAYAASIVYCVTIYTAKIGALNQMKRIFTGNRKGFIHWASWALIGLITCVYTASFFLWIFPCIPIARY